jgi:LmbE family N-acetylglucosaminyl deacetylase
VVPDSQDFIYYDLRQRKRSEAISLLFPGWQPGDERVAVLSPHDDDAALGAGYILQAARANGGEVYIFIFCNGCAGYSSPEEKKTIVATRRRETMAAYAALDVPEDHIVRFDYPDFSLLPNLGWQMPWNVDGTMACHLRALRDRHITRVVVPNGYREHIDHEATYRIGAYDAPQAGDPILADWGLAPPVRSIVQYAVWGDFSPEDALVSGESVELRANRAIVARPSVEERVQKAIRAFRSQGQIIEGLIAARQGRQFEGRYLELYVDFDPRPALDYRPYHNLIANIT